MAKNHNGKTNSTGVKQLRGGALDEYLERCVIRMYQGCAEVGEVYKYNQAELSRIAQVSRETVRSHQGYINGVLEKLHANRRTSSGAIQISNYLSKIGRLEVELANSRLQYDALRGLYVDLFWLLHTQSVDVANLVLKKAESVFRHQRICPLCHSTKNEECLIKPSGR